MADLRIMPASATSTIDDLQRTDALVDVHCHVLPTLDDGAFDLTDSIAMATQAWSDGIGTICATPHVRDDHDVPIAELPGRVAALNASLRELGIPVNIVEGAELSASRADHLTDLQLREVSLGATGRWILLEPQPGPIGEDFADLVDRLHARGVRCVIAHPERHAAADIATWLTRLVGSGALVQVTAAFLVGHGAAPVILDWASQGLVHLVGSDAHSARVGRPVAVSDGLRALATVPRIAEHMAWIASTGPQAVLAGQPIDVPF